MNTISRYSNLVWATERVKERIGLTLEDESKNDVIQELLQDTCGSTLSTPVDDVYRPYLVAGLMLVQDVGRNTITKSGDDEFKDFTPLALVLYKYQHSIDMKCQTILDESLKMYNYISALSSESAIADSAPKIQRTAKFGGSLINNPVF